jgi:quinoprotein glucose dehydrogenase
LPEPFARQRLDAQLLTQRTPAMHDWAVQQFANLRSEGQFVPLGLDRQTVVFPGFDGGAEWGGAAVDPHRAVLYLNSNDIAWTGGLARIPFSSDPSEALYRQNCLSCHGADRKGSPPAFPSLVDIEQRRSHAKLQATIRAGAGRMPAFAQLDDSQVSALIHYVSSGETSVAADAADKERTPGALPRQYRDQGGEYEFTGYRKFLDPEGYPAVMPPWGTLNAIDLNTGQYLWRVPLGEYPALASGQGAATGSENYGGPVLTSSGVLFIAATLFDRKLRAFDSSSGELLHEWQLPYAGTATPAIYSIAGRQYVVIATTGDRDASGPQGSAYVAFALP